MRLTAALLAAVLPSAAAAAAARTPIWVLLLVAFISNGGVLWLVDRRTRRRIETATAAKTDAERESITADVYDKMSRHVREQLLEMEQRVQTAQAAQMTAQAALTAALSRAADDRREVHRQLQASEEARHGEREEYRRKLVALEERIAELETALAATGVKERRLRARRDEDEPST